MSLRAKLLALAASGAISAFATAASAQVTAVVTETTASLESNFDSGDYDGFDISGAVEAQEGDGGSFHATSQVTTDIIEFRNGNSAAGFFARLFSRTVVDITFTNDSGRVVTPSLLSTITAEGMGMFVAPGSCLPDTRGCLPGLPGTSTGFQDFNPSSGSQGNGIAGSSFLFRITGNGQTMYELDGSIALVRDEATGVNNFVTDLDKAAATLSGFRLNSPEGSESEFGFAWDSTQIFVPFPEGTLLQPGESATLRYETITESFSTSDSNFSNDDLIAYASFGDPVGRRGGIGARMPFAEGGLTYDLFAFDFPTYEDGVLRYTLSGFSPTVPEPASWAMMIAGFGLVGGAMRRRGARSLAPARA